MRREKYLLKMSHVVAFFDDEYGTRTAAYKISFGASFTAYKSS